MRIEKEVKGIDFSNLEFTMPNTWESVITKSGFPFNILNPSSKLSKVTVMGIAL